MDRQEIERKAREYLSQEEVPYFKEDLQKALDQGDWGELEDRFYRELDFGTGGLRGIIGGGINRLNPYTIRKATQGLADYILAQGIKNPQAAIAYDSRRFSDLFAKTAALVLAARGIKARLFSTLHPTPLLSFAVRELGAAAGIVVTASHNPPEYNGYKVYWSDGAQLVPPHDRGVIDQVRRQEGLIPLPDEEEALNSGLLSYIGGEIDDRYAALVHSRLLRPGLIKEQAPRLKVVYTPLHGTGRALVERLLGELGIPCLTVPEQREPDGGFPTVAFPNPEEPAALKMALDLAVREGASLVIGTDPDADRIAIAAPDGGGNFRLFTGNQLGVLLGDYIFSSLGETGRLPDRPAFIKTIVTTELQSLLAAKHGVKVYDVLTGFKYIGQKIRELEAAGENYVFGGEESCGYLALKEIRDKDAVSTAVIVAEMALYHLSRGQSLSGRLEEIYGELGYFEEALISRTIKGAAGVGEIQGIMARLRQNPPVELGGVKVREILDYREKNRMNLPPSDVVQIRLEDETLITVRPSGTEPKIKFYASLRGRPGQPPAEAQRDCAGRLERIRAYLNALS